MQSKMLAALSELEQDALIELWEVDLRPFGGELLRFCNHLNAKKQEFVLWKGQKYQSYPIQGDGFELTAQGAGNRPKLTVSNLFGLVTGLAERHNKLIGAKVTRRQTYARFLDAGNFDGGNPQADPLQEAVSQFVIERLSALTAETAQFELAAPAEADGAVIPARIILEDVCCWQYRGEGCGYTGKPVADKDDMPTDDPKKDACSGRILGCQARHGATAVLPFGGFISADKVGG